MNVAITYCLDGHLWSPEFEKHCPQCAAGDNKHALGLIEEIEKTLPEPTDWTIWKKLHLFKEILTDRE